ncbi:hypothetical protein DAI21_19075 [Lelliottia sp. WB101]|nr:hypothetical protein DAI21_19075 [Lelliottia sp. WB101]
MKVSIFKVQPRQIFHLLRFISMKYLRTKNKPHSYCVLLPLRALAQKIPTYTALWMANVYNKKKCIV